MIDIERLKSMDKPQIMQIVNEMQINPIVKAVVVSQLRKLEPEKIKSILDQVGDQITALQSGDPEKINELKNQLEKYANQSGIPAAYIDQLFNLFKPEVSQ